MSAKIRLSYETPEELAAIRGKLEAYIRRVELEPSKGRYKRAYFHLKSIPTNGDTQGQSKDSACLSPQNVV